MLAATLPVRRTLLCLGLALCAAALCSPAAEAAAPPAKRRVGVVKFHGPAESATRNRVVRVVKAARYQVIGWEQIDKATKRLKVRLDDDAGFAAVARALGLVAFITGELTTRKATLTTRAGETGAVLEEASWSAPNPRKLAVTVAKKFWRRLGPAIARSSAPSRAKVEPPVAQESPAKGAAEPPDEVDNPQDGTAEGAATPTKARAGDTRGTLAAAPKAETKDQNKDENKDEDENKDKDAEDVAASGENPEPELGASDHLRDLEGARSSRPEALIVAVGPRLARRSLTYVDDPDGTNSSYHLAAAPLAAVDADFYPGALSSAGALANIGVTAGLSYMVPVVRSQFTTGGNFYTTKSLGWSAGLKGRLPIGVYGTVAIGSREYQVVDANAIVSADVPTTNYRFVRGGAGVRRSVSPRVVVMANAAYLYCLTVGPIGESGYFPHATGWGLEGGAALGFRISRDVELQAGGTLQRFRLDFHVSAEDAMNGARTGGGAVDQYLEGWLAVAFVMGREARTLPAK